MSRNPRDPDLPARMTPDPTVEAAQREFLAYDAAPAWALKPTETVCLSCFLVKPCECDDALRPTIATVTTKAGTK